LYSCGVIGLPPMLAIFFALVCGRTTLPNASDALFTKATAPWASRLLAH
jgi:hypothetical protein